MGEYNYFQEIILMGDSSKYLFIQKYLRCDLSLAELQECNVYVSFYKEYRVKKEGDILYIYSPLVPKAKRIIIFQDITHILLYYNKVDKIIVFSSFPYSKMDLLLEVQVIAKGVLVSEILFLLYIENRKFGETDLENEGESLKSAEKACKELGIQTLRFVEGNDSMEVFNTQPDFIKRFKNSYTNNIKRIEERFNENYNSDYDFYVLDYFTKFSILNPNEYDRYNRIFSYRTVRNYNDVWISYATEFAREYLYGEGGILEVVLNFYRDYIIEISFWNLEEDVELLKKEIVNEFKTYFSCYKSFKVPKTELEYIKMINNTKTISLKVLFKKRVQGFIDKVIRNKTKEHLENCLKAIDLERGIENEIKN